MVMSCHLTYDCLHITSTAPKHRESGLKLTTHTPRTVVYYAHYASYHSEAHFARPDEFYPERWASVPPADFANGCKDAVIPFSAGPRDCIGKK